MAGLLLKLRTWWETADRTQRSVTVFGGAFLVLLLGATFYFASKPKMTMAFGGLSPSDQGTVTAEIQKLGIPVEFDSSGNVLVPSDKVAEVRSKLAMAGKVPASGHVGNEELAKFSLMGPPNVEQERLKTIAEGELARSIEMVEGIGSARVHLTRGERGVFASEKKPPSASIFLTEKPGGAITTETARAIAMMVVHGTTGLEASRVFVLDNAGRPLYDGSAGTGSSSMASQKLQAEQQESLRRERDLQAKLDAVVGVGNSLVTVNLEMDFTPEEKTTEDFKMKEGKLSEAVREDVTKPGSSGVNPADLGGVNANDPSSTATAGQAANSSNPSYKGEQLRYSIPYTRTTTTTEKEIGAIKTMSISVLVNKDIVKDTVAVEEFLTGYIGNNEDKFTSTVTSIPFDKTAEQTAKTGAGAAKSRETMQMVMSLLPVGALLIVAFLVMKSIAKAAKAQTVMVHALPNGTLPAGALPMGGGSTAGAYEGERQIEGGSNAQGAPQLRAANALPGEEVGEIETRMNKPLEQIKRMAQDRPESVAMLLKSWMLEERR